MKKKTAGEQVRKCAGENFHPPTFPLSHFLFLLLLWSTFSARAVDRITASLSVTNGTTNGQTITINASVRTWTNSVQVSTTQILTNSTTAGAKSNLFNQLALNSIVSVNPPVDRGSTNFDIVAASGVSLTVTLSAGWGTVSYATQTVASAVGVRVPITAEAAAQQTNITSLLIDALRSALATNAFWESSPAMANFVGLTNAQTISGAKTLTGATILSNAANIFYKSTISNALSITGNGGLITNGTFRTPILISPTLTNGLNYGNAFRSPGTGPDSEQYGNGSAASGDSSVALGAPATASGDNSVAIGNTSVASGTSSTALGDGSIAYSNSAVAIGASTSATNLNSVALGVQASTTASNQIRLGTASYHVSIPGNLHVSGGTTNIQAYGTNAFSDMAFRRFAITTLGNGNNDGIIVGTNTYVEVSGPSAAFAILGINGSPLRNGHVLIIDNNTGQNMTIAVEGGATGNAVVAEQRVISNTGADRATTGNGSAILIYNAFAARWKLLHLDP